MTREALDSECEVPSRILRQCLLLLAAEGCVVVGALLLFGPEIGSGTWLGIALGVCVVPGFVLSTLHCRNRIERSYVRRAEFTGVLLLILATSLGTGPERVTTLPAPTPLLGGVAVSLASLLPIGEWIRGQVRARVRTTSGAFILHAILGAVGSLLTLFVLSQALSWAFVSMGSAPWGRVTRIGLVVATAPILWAWRQISMETPQEARMRYLRAIETRTALRAAATQAGTEEDSEDWSPRPRPVSAGSIPWRRMATAAWVTCLITLQFSGSH